MALGIASCRRTMTRIQRLLLWLAVTILPIPAIGDTVAGFTGLQSDVKFAVCNHGRVLRSDDQRADYVRRARRASLDRDDADDRPHDLG